MGNNYNKEAFYMHIKFIGLEIERFYNNFRNVTTLKDIIKCWEIDPLQNIDLLEQINAYFDILQEKRNDKNNQDLSLRECLILKLNNVFAPELNYIFEKMNKLSSKQFMPLVLILTSENSNKKISIDIKKYDQIDPRFFFIENYIEDSDKIEQTIVPIILRFCSIHNELGDKFSLNKSEKDEETFDLIERAFPFNLNIVCIGRFGQGKSTGVNEILQEYKAKESNKGCSQTKNITFYQVKNEPIRILDVPGFESSETVKDAVEKFKTFGKKINKLRDSIHIILYFLNYNETRCFMELEYPILEEISNHESAQIIYVITHSKSKNPKTKHKIFERINSGIQGVTRNKPLFNKIKMFEAKENNVVFVNFHYDEDLEIEPFGKKELFKKIYDFFVNSECYKDSLNKYSSKEEIDKNALKLRAQAQNILLPNKIWGGAVGLIPFVDWALQKFVIKKNAVIKVGQIFEIDAKFIDKDIEKEEKLKNKKENNESDIIYCSPELINNNSNCYVDANKLIEETKKYKVGKTVECSTQVGKYVGGASFVNFANISTTQAFNLSSQAANLASQATKLAHQGAQFSAKAAQLTEQANNVNKIWNFFTGTGTALAEKAAVYASKGSSYASKAANFASKAASTEAAAAESAAIGTLSNFAGYAFLGIGIIIGVGCGAYYTHKFCEETLDKFVEYYKKNSFKIKNSYEEAAKYFLN